MASSSDGFSLKESPPKRKQSRLLDARGSVNEKSFDAETNRTLYRYVPRVVLDWLSRREPRPVHPDDPVQTDMRYRSLADQGILPFQPQIECFDHASIIVADVSGFTKLNESFSWRKDGAEQVTVHLNKYFTLLLDIIDKHGGDCVKFAGDALIVFFSSTRDERHKEAELRKKKVHTLHMRGKAMDKFQAEAYSASAKWAHNDASNTREEQLIRAHSVREGSLKEGDLNHFARERFWRKSEHARFCILLPGRLDLYKNREYALVMNMRDWVSIPLYHDTLVEEERDARFGEHAFAIRSIDGVSPQQVLACADDQEREEWIAVIRMSLRSLPTSQSDEKNAGGKVNSNSVAEGWMFKVGNSFKTWKMRYFILLDDVLLYFISRRHAQKYNAKGIIVLAPTTTVAADAKSEKRNSWTLLPSPNSRSYTLSCATENDRDEWMFAINKLVTKLQLHHNNTSSRSLLNNSPPHPYHHGPAGLLRLTNGGGGGGGAGGGGGGTGENTPTTSSQEPSPSGSLNGLPGTITGMGTGSGVSGSGSGSSPVQAPGTLSKTPSGKTRHNSNPTTTILASFPEEASTSPPTTLAFRGGDAPVLLAQTSTSSTSSSSSTSSDAVLGMGRGGPFSPGPLARAQTAPPESELKQPGSGFPRDIRVDVNRPSFSRTPLPNEWVTASGNGTPTQGSDHAPLPPPHRVSSTPPNASSSSALAPLAIVGSPSLQSMIGTPPINQTLPAMPKPLTPSLVFGGGGASNRSYSMASPSGVPTPIATSIPGSASSASGTGAGGAHRASTTPPKTPRTMHSQSVSFHTSPLARGGVGGNNSSQVTGSASVMVGSTPSTKKTATFASSVTGGNGNVSGNGSPAGANSGKVPGGSGSPTRRARSLTAVISAAFTNRRGSTGNDASEKERARMGSTKEGWLLKYPDQEKAKALRNVTKKRYFVLMPDRLMYFKSKSHAYAPGDSDAKGVIHLYRDSSCRPSSAREHGFEVVAAERERTYVMTCSDGPERDRWMEAIHSVLPVLPFSPRYSPAPQRMSYQAKTLPVRSSPPQSVDDRVLHPPHNTVHSFQSSSTATPLSYLNLSTSTLNHHAAHASASTSLAGLPPLSASHAATSAAAATLPPLHHGMYHAAAAQSNATAHGIHTSTSSASSSSTAAVTGTNSSFGLSEEEDGVQVYPTSVKEGWLWKRDSAGRNWAKRYFVLLRDEGLIYFKFKRLAAIGASNSTRVRVSTQTTLQKENDVGRMFAFSIWQWGARKYLLASYDDRGVESWMQAIEQLLPTIEENDDRIMVAQNTLRAVQCALELQETGGTYSAGGVELALHIAVASGTVYGMHVGGENLEWEFVMAGEPFQQLSRGVDLSNPGEVVVSLKSWKLINEHCEGQAIPRSICKTGEVKIIKVHHPVKVRPLARVTGRDGTDLASHQLVADAVRAYLSRCVLLKVDARQTRWLGELRTASVIFVNLKGLALNRKDSGSIASLERTHKVCRSLQKIIARNQGYRRQFLVDDKGTVLIAVFGVPPYAHEEDAYRAVKTALEIRASLIALDCQHSIGVATGDVYVGSVGSGKRQEHAVVGDTVNISARLSGRSQNAGIICDMGTYQACRFFIKMRPEGDIFVKGKKNRIQIFTPLGLERLNLAGHAETAGRAEECKYFSNAFKGVMMRGWSQAMLFEGEPGIGKTQLIGNFYRECVGSRLAKTLYVAADPTEQGVPFSMWRIVLEQLMNLTSLPPGHKRTHAVQEYLDSIPRDVKTQRIIDFEACLHNLGLLNPIIQTKFPGNTWTNTQTIEDNGKMEQTVQLICGIMQGAFKGHEGHTNVRGIATEFEEKELEQPPGPPCCVLLVDDLHYADRASLKVLTAVADRVSALVLVMTSRPFPPNQLETPEGKRWLEARRKILKSSNMFTLKGLDRKACERIVLQALSQPEKVSEEKTDPLSVKEGFLMKFSGNNIKTWKRRYFMLYKDHMQYYKDKKNALAAYLQVGPNGVPRTEPKGTIPLYSNSSITSDSGKDWIFVLKPHEDIRSYVLNASSAEERNDWIDLIEKVTSTLPYKQSERELKEDPQADPASTLSTISVASSTMSTISTYSTASASAATGFPRAFATTTGAGPANATTNTNTNSSFTFTGTASAPATPPPHSHFIRPLPKTAPPKAAQTHSRTATGGTSGSPVKELPTSIASAALSDGGRAMNHLAVDAPSPPSSHVSPLATPNSAAFDSLASPSSVHPMSFLGSYSSPISPSDAPRGGDRDRRTHTMSSPEPMKGLFINLASANSTPQKPATSMSATAKLQMGSSSLPALPNANPNRGSNATPTPTLLPGSGGGDGGGGEHDGPFGAGFWNTSHHPHPHLHGTSEDGFSEDGAGSGAGSGKGAVSPGNSIGSNSSSHTAASSISPPATPLPAPPVLVSSTSLTPMDPNALIAPEIIDTIMKRCQGNPLFSVEVVWHLRDTGFIKRNENQQWVPSVPEGTIDNVQLPQSLKALVIKRIDRLSVTEALICKLASVFSREFSKRHLLALFVSENGTRDQLENALAILQASDILGKIEQLPTARPQKGTDGHDPVGPPPAARSPRSATMALMAGRAAHTTMIQYLAPVPLADSHTPSHAAQPEQPSAFFNKTGAITTHKDLTMSQTILLQSQASALQSQEKMISDARDRAKQQAMSPTSLDDVYYFLNDLLQVACYEMIPFALRQTLHARVSDIVTHDPTPHSRPSLSVATGAESKEPFSASPTVLGPLRIEGGSREAGTEALPGTRLDRKFRQSITVVSPGFVPPSPSSHARSMTQPSGFSGLTVSTAASMSSFAELAGKSSSPSLVLRDIKVPQHITKEGVGGGTGMIGDPEIYEDPEDAGGDDDLRDDSKRASVLSSVSNTGSEYDPEVDRDVDPDHEVTGFGSAKHRGSDSASGSHIVDREDRDHLSRLVSDSRENSPTASPMMKGSHSRRGHKLFPGKGNDHRGLGPGSDEAAFDFATGNEGSEGSSDAGTPAESPNDSPASSTPGTPTGIAHHLGKPDNGGGSAAGQPPPVASPSSAASPSEQQGNHAHSTTGPHHHRQHHTRAGTGGSSARGPGVRTPSALDVDRAAASLASNAHSRNSSVTSSSSPSSVNSAHSTFSTQSLQSDGGKIENLPPKAGGSLPHSRTQSSDRPPSRPKSRTDGASLISPSSSPTDVFSPSSRSSPNHMISTGPHTGVFPSRTSSRDTPPPKSATSSSSSQQ